LADDDTLGGRVRRYVRVSTAMGGLAARLAGQRYLGLPLDRPQHAADLKAALGGIKGPLMKVAQLLATIPNALPAEYANELATLQANAPPSMRRRARRRWARCIARSRSTGVRSPASCNIPTWARRSRRTCSN